MNVCIQLLLTSKDHSRSYSNNWGVEPQTTPRYTQTQTRGPGHWRPPPAPPSPRLTHDTAFEPVISPLPPWSCKALWDWRRSSGPSEPEAKPPGTPIWTRQTSPVSRAPPNAAALTKQHFRTDYDSNRKAFDYELVWNVINTLIVPADQQKHL